MREKMKVLNYYYEQRDNDILNVEDYNETLDRCDFIYIYIQYQRVADKKEYRDPDRVVVTQLFSETKITDFSTLFDFCESPKYETTRWELRQI